jgi:hypothetical protein
MGSEDLAFHATVTETARHEKAVGALHLGPGFLVFLGMLLLRDHEANDIRDQHSR